MDTGSDFKVPESINSAGVPNLVERLPFFTTNGMQYAIEIAVGSPQQKKILVTLDTGSSQLAIFVVPNRSRAYWILSACLSFMMMGLLYSYYQVGALGPHLEGYESLDAGESSPLVSGSTSTWAGTPLSKVAPTESLGTSKPLYGDSSYQNCDDTGL